MTKFFFVSHLCNPKYAHREEDMLDMAPSLRENSRLGTLCHKLSNSTYHIQFSILCSMSNHINQGNGRNETYFTSCYKKLLC